MGAVRLIGGEQWPSGWARSLHWPAECEQWKRKSVTFRVWGREAERDEKRKRGNDWGEGTETREDVKRNIEKEEHREDWVRGSERKRENVFFWPGVAWETSAKLPQLRNNRPLSGVLGLGIFSRNYHLNESCAVQLQMYTSHVSRVFVKQRPLLNCSHLAVSVCALSYAFYIKGIINCSTVQGMTWCVCGLKVNSGHFLKVCYFLLGYHLTFSLNGNWWHLLFWISPKMVDLTNVEHTT